MKRFDLADVERLARLDEGQLSVLVAQLEYYPADAPTRLELPSIFWILDIAIHIRATALQGAPVSAEPEWAELANRPELNEAAELVKEISAAGAEPALRLRR